MTWRWFGADGVPPARFVDLLRASARAAGFRPVDVPGPRVQRVRIRSYENGQSWAIVRLDEDALSSALFAAMQGTMDGALSAASYSARRAAGEVRARIIPHKGLLHVTNRHLDPLACDAAQESPRDVYVATESQMLNWMPMRIGLAASPVVWSADEELWELPAEDNLSPRAIKRLRELARSAATATDLCLQPLSPGKHELALDSGRGRTWSTLDEDELRFLEMFARQEYLRLGDRVERERLAGFIGLLAERSSTQVLDQSEQPDDASSQTAHQTSPLPPPRAASARPPIASPSETPRSLSEPPANDATPPPEPLAEVEEHARYELALGSPVMNCTGAELKRLVEHFSSVAHLIPAGASTTQLSRLAQVLTDAPCEDDLWRRGQAFFEYTLRHGAFPEWQRASLDPVGDLIAGLSSKREGGRSELVEACFRSGTSAFATRTDLLLAAINRLI